MCKEVGKERGKVYQAPPGPANPASPASKSSLEIQSRNPQNPACPGSPASKASQPVSPASPASKSSLAILEMQPRNLPNPLARSLFVIRAAGRLTKFSQINAWNSTPNSVWWLNLCPSSASSFFLCFRRVLREHFQLQKNISAVYITCLCGVPTWGYPVTQPGLDEWITLRDRPLLLTVTVTVTITPYWTTPPATFQTSELQIPIC